MGELDPVHWDVIEAAVGPPAPEIESFVERMRDDVRDAEPYVAVKAVHDALDEALGEDLAVAGQGEVYLVTYLLEKEGVIDPGAGAAARGLPSLVDRRPDGDRLRELFWEPERTMWWLGIQLGVHWALVRYWLYEADIPLRERNFPPAAMERIRDHREDR